MKILNYIHIALVALLVVSCERDPMVWEVTTSSDDVILNLGITTKASYPDSNSIYDSENEIQTLRVYAFNGGGQFDRMAYFGTPQSVYEMEVERTDDKDLYFIVNEPSELSAELDKITSVSTLKAVDCTIAEFLNGNNGFNGSDNPTFAMPMSSSITGVDASLNKSLSVSVDRCVARVDLYLTMGDLYKSISLDGDTKFEVSGVHDDVIILSGTTPSTYESEDFTVSASSATLSEDTTTRVLSFYAAERTYNYSTSPITIKTSNLNVDDVDKGFEIVLGDTDDTITSTLSKITRNYVYQITATLGVYETVEKVDYKIMDWDTVYVDGDLSGVILAVDGTVALDWFRNGYSYTAPAAAFGGDREIEVYIPLSRNDDGTFNYRDTPLVTLNSDGTTDGTYNILGYTDYDNTTNWITGASLTTAALSGQIVFTYTPQDIPYEYETFPIKIKSQNIIKTMNVIYDNGYIPQVNIPTATEIAYLQGLGIGTDWIYDITNGMSVAKRGYDKHPAETEEVMFAVEQTDGSYLYEGEASMTGAEAQTYCQTMLGESWYLPSKDMLQVVQLKGRELGTSYRFQNTSEAYYWSSTEGDDGEYMAVPMSKVSINKFLESGDSDDWDAIAPISVDANISSSDDGAKVYYVRCFLNM